MDVALEFDLANISSVEFGVGYDEGDNRAFCLIPVDNDVQDALLEMVRRTWDIMQKLNEPRKYEPAEKYGSTEYVCVPLDDDVAEFMRNLHKAENIIYNVHVLKEPDTIFCYFSRLIDGGGRRLTAVRRAVHFKGVLKSRLIHLLSDALRLVNDRVFRLDMDFDLLVDSGYIHVLRPSSFEFVGKLQQALLESVPEIVKVIQNDMPFVDFRPILEYATKHPRAAPYLASIRSQEENKNIDRKRLIDHCKATGVDVHLEGDKIVVAKGQEMAFLEVLDRRRYEVELVEGSPERFRATSREKI